MNITYRQGYMKLAGRLEDVEKIEGEWVLGLLTGEIRDGNS